VHWTVPAGWRSESFWGYVCLIHHNFVAINVTIWEKEVEVIELKCAQFCINIKYILDFRDNK